MSYPTAKGKVCVQNPPQPRPKRKLANAPFQSHEAFVRLLILMRARGGDGSVVSSNQRQRGADELAALTRTAFCSEPIFYFPPFRPREDAAPAANTMKGPPPREFDASLTS